MLRIICLSLTIFITQLYATDVREVQDGPIHEAFVTQEFGNVIYQIIEVRPPPTIQEKIPKQPSKDVQWIDGYWAWSGTENDFIWVSGIWRRPPPGHIWIAGKWQRLDSGWAWLPGFWSSVKEEELQYISKMPPDSLDENVPRPPSSEFFWILGTWVFDSNKKQFYWNEGRWQRFDPTWVYVPAHYIWRDNGYLFIGNYWDWPLEERGQIYATVSIQPEIRNVIVYEPTIIIEYPTIFEVLYPYWPNYICLFHTYFYFHPEYWNNLGISVPWWVWDEWWCFAWQDQLALWWWWSHPGFPQPTWMTLSLAQKIAPPSQTILTRMKTVAPLINITPNGVVGDNEIIQAINKNTHSHDPLVPVDPKEWKKIQEEVMPEKIKRPILKAEGGQEEINSLQKPKFGPGKETLPKAPERMSAPPKPNKLEEAVVPLPRKYVPPKQPPRTNVPPPKKTPSTRTQSHLPRPTPSQSQSRAHSSVQNRSQFKPPASFQQSNRMRLESGPAMRTPTTSQKKKERP